VLGGFGSEQRLSFIFRAKRLEVVVYFYFLTVETALSCEMSPTTLRDSIIRKVKQSRYRPGVAQRVPGS
jgi:hypothetical protein